MGCGIYRKKEWRKIFKIEGAKWGGSKWTELHNPIQIVEYKEGTKEDETRVTLEYMTKYGWWNVRGGPYCQVEMTNPPKALIPKLPKLPKLPQSIKTNVYNNYTNTFNNIYDTKPNRAGKKWTIEEEQKLLTLLQSEISIEDIFIIFQRTEFAINSRLIKIYCEEL